MVEFITIIFCMLLGALGGYVKRNQLSILKSFLLGWATSTLGFLIILSIIIFNNPHPERHDSNIIALIIIILAPIVIGVGFVISSNPLD